MNVTVTIDDEVCKKARHKAVDDGLSLSGWITKLIQKEIQIPPQQSLVDALRCPELENIELEFTRELSPVRDVDLS